MGVCHDRVYRCRGRRLYRGGLQIFNRNDSFERRMYISHKDIHDKYSRFFSDWNCCCIGNENRISGFQNRIISEGWDMRRLYYIFLLRIGDNRFDEKREDASGGHLYRTQCYAWGIGCICRPGNCRKGIKGR